ncbi:LPS export ABC transporter permease LptG [Afifella marina]|uniref:Lipopolysaccharide export system permease protein n=1 Tax=Afifella marina DSM 2698 TaxID=1120955 RepID=A0A1G5N2C7_AFIMA|nr:LPS export ABC transporter permease LptG [Afifella marina]MBK1622342.1 LPS export ABC transporter permease LptG [Afifella marina DSM 2698]MBK1626944.1 LPS export ABC transporter permease LptG [Afifella marina]MBK5919126.1 LPS export ABC transporter permease LptG [Afifella marina]RAI20145.1 LPS export ABC transporter permease LptG [Afifella marina DSM 2698]SCZ31536.1 lipopolysaccharide export system permease protein [Afifella marina DSM 2698]
MILATYIGRRFLVSLGTILIALLTLVFLVDYVELLRRFSDAEAFTSLIGLKLALMRAPALLEDILPFLFLFSATICFLNLSRKLELVVARGAGVSVWGFLRAPFFLALVIGLASTFLFNPLATELKERSDRIEASLSDGIAASSADAIWFRQEGLDGPSIIRAANYDSSAKELRGVTAFLFNPDGSFQAKLVSLSASYRPGRWIFAKTRYMSGEGAADRFDRYILPTSLTPDQVNLTLLRPDRLSVWTLRRFIDTAAQTGLNTARFTLAFHSLLARPLFLMAMVTVAATVSLRLSRYGGVGKLALTGIIIGFLLYVATEIVSDMGSNGILNPVLAAWSPAVLAMLFGATALLYQEDG